MSRRENRTLEKLATHLNRKNIRFFRAEGAPVLMFVMESDHGHPVPVFLSVLGDGTGFSVTTTFPICVPEPKRNAMALATTRANNSMILGGFQFDLDSGDLRYVAAQGCGPKGPGDPEIARTVGVCVAMVDHYMEPFVRVIYANADPAEAVAKADDQEGREETGDPGEEPDPALEEEEKFVNNTNLGPPGDADQRARNFWGEMVDHTREKDPAEDRGSESESGTE